MLSDAHGHIFTGEVRMGLLTSVSEGILIPDTCECKSFVQAP